MSEANRSMLSRTYAEAAKGLWPHEVKLAPGTVLYRFIDTTKAPPKTGADGPWWFEFEHYKTIESFAARHGYSTGYAARLFAAILYEWSEVNGVARARVRVPLV